MHYLVSYEIPREVRDKAQERFKSGGALPPSRSDDGRAVAPY